MSAQDVTVPPLNEQQARAILEEARNRGMMEGDIPADPAVLVQYASQLVAHAKLAFDNGNHGDSVMAVLFNAEVDMNPSTPVPPPQVAAAAPPPGAVAPPPGAPPVAPPAPQPPAGSSFDLPTMSDETIAGMIGALENPQYANQPNVQQELEVLKGEQTRRAGGQPVAQAAQPQAVAPPAQAPQAAAPPAPPVPAAAPAAPVAAPQPPVPPGAPVAPPAGGVGAPPAAPPAPNAPAPPGPEAPQPPAEGQLPAPAPDQEAAEKSQLEGQLTLASLQAWGVDPGAVQTLSMETLRGIVTNPAGPTATDTTVTAPPEAAPTTEQREALIAQITGPILKAYGRGRKEIPEIGEQELALMVSIPDGNVTMEQLNSVRAADGVVSSVLPPSLKQQAAPAAPIAPPPGTPGAPPAPPAPAPVAPAPVAPAPVAAPPSAFAPPAEAAAPQQAQAQPPAAPAPLPDSPNPVAFSPVAAAAGAPGGGFSAPVAPPAGAPPMPAVGEGSVRAMQIIQEENFPIPPEIEGDPPRLPNDLSKVSDGELQSFHARFHACESRANWVISKFDTDEIGPVKKLLRDRRREVAAHIGTTDENNKKLTKDAKEVLIEQDQYVQQYVGQLEEIEATMGKLKVLRDNYHQDVSTCSRQWSMRSGEAEKQPVPR